MFKKKFKVRKAKQLCKLYHANSEYDKEKFLRELIRLHTNLHPVDISSDLPLPIFCKYEQTIVEEVLKDLNYQLTFYHSNDPFEAEGIVCEEGTTTISFK